MVSRIRTAEDHNDVGLQVPPFPRAYVRYQVSDFVGGALTHTLSKETAAIYICLNATDDSGDFRLPLSGGVGTWRCKANLLWASSVLEGRTIAMTLSGAPDGANVEIWEF